MGDIEMNTYIRVLWDLSITATLSLGNNIMAVIQGWLLFRGFVTMEVYVAKFIPDQSLWPLYSIWLLFRGGC